MTLEETKQILRVLRVNYPQSFRNMTPDDTKDFLALWSEAFADDPVGLVASAVKSIIYGDVREFAPNIAQVKEKMYTITHADSELSEQEAWELIRKACSNSLWNSKTEHEKLPQLLQKLVTPQQLKAWAMLDVDEFNTVVASNFMRSYKSRKVQQKEYDMLPNNVKQLISSSVKMIGSDEDEED